VVFFFLVFVFRYTIDNFRVTLCLVFKTSPCKNEFGYIKMNLESEHIFRRMVSHFWHGQKPTLRWTSITSGGESCSCSSCFMLWKPEKSTCLMDLYVRTHTYLTDEHPIAYERVSIKLGHRAKKETANGASLVRQKTRSHWIFYPRTLVASSTCRRTVFSNLVAGQFPTEC